MRYNKKKDLIMINCSACNMVMEPEETGEPYVRYKNAILCCSCRFDILEHIYYSGGDGGLIHIIFKELLMSPFNRKRRIQIRDYKNIFNKLLHKYNFSCVHCGTGEKLSIDHIKPVSKGGRDNIENLQILCRSCNSKKGSK